MNTKILIFTAMLFLAGCENNSNTTSESDDPISCAGFYAPTLSIYLLDSLSGENITNALVTLQTVTSVGVQSTTVSWNDVEKSYFVNPTDLVIGAYSVTAAEANYNSGVSLNNEFIVDTSCGAINDWSITMYLCPIGTACL